MTNYLPRKTKRQKIKSSSNTRNPVLGKVDFEKHKDIYLEEVQNSISFISKDVDFFTEVKARQLRELAQKYMGKPSDLKVLDVGCGIGLTDRFLTGHFGKVYGIDVAKGLVQKAKEINPTANYKSYKGKVLPYPDRSIDVTFAICVLHHVPPERHDSFMGELRRVTKKNGLIVIFEHNPLNPLTIYAVSRCRLDDDAILLSASKTQGLITGQGLQAVDKGYILFTPFRGKPFTLLDRALGWLPLGAQYYVAGINKSPR
jgi:SAM-dependent methyltransferase